MLRNFESRNTIKRMPEDRSDSSNTQSVVLRAVALLAAVATRGEAVPLGAIAEATRLPKPTAYRLLRELADGGWIVREPVGAGGFSPGPRLERLALSLMEHGGSRTVRHSILARLVAELGETCNVTVLDGAQVLYRDRVESPSPLRAHLQPGSRVPLHCTASGKLFLAELPKRRRDRLLEQIRFDRLTDHTLTDRAALEAQLHCIRKQRFAVDNEEYVAGLVCVAVPIPDSRGKTIAAVAVQAPVSRLPSDRAATALPALQRAATALAATFEGTGTRVPADAIPRGRTLIDRSR